MQQSMISMARWFPRREVHDMITLNRSIAWIFGLTLALLTASVAQVEQQPRQKAPGSVFVQLIAFASDSLGVTRVDQYVQIPYSELTFLAKEDSYVSRFELSAQLKAADGAVAWQRAQSVELRVTEYAQTVSNRFSHLRSLTGLVPPGTYEYIMQIVDGESRRSTTLRREVVIRDLQKDSLAASDLLFASRVSRTDDRTSVVPNVNNVFGMGMDRFYLFFELYKRRSLDTVALTYFIVNAQGEAVLTSTRNERVDDGTTVVIWNVDSLPPQAGQYRLIVRIVPIGVPDSSSTRLEIARAFSVGWPELPPSIQDVSKAIAQLRYIAQESEIEYMEAGETEEEQKERLLAFWKKRDPDPRTPQNELMQEYYGRVAYANEHFAHYMEGWRTDMGMVFVRFGPPENVERHPFETDRRPYEVWYYYEQNRQFIFVDESGFGDYRLRYPTTDLWGRIR